MFSKSVLAALGGGALATAASVYLGVVHYVGSADCPDGQTLRDPVKLALELNPALSAEQQAAIRLRAGGERICLPRKHPEPGGEILAANDARYQKAGSVEPGLFRSAVEQKAAMESLKAAVSGADGVWTPYGKGNLNSSGGHNLVGARADNFAYDPVGKRLFAALGSGGVWMSQAQNGDVRTLADSWTAVDRKLPSIIVSAVAWSSANGGTLIAVGGESLMGSSSYLGLGAFWSTDLGQSWHQATGVPDGALAFKAEVDPSNPNIVYTATSKGLFRSDDAGRSYINVRLPTGDCAGVEALGSCQFANYVTDVVIKHPGGTTNVSCGAKGCPVLAGVGFRVGNGLAYQDGRPMAPNNGLYRSDSGERDSFVKLEVSAINNESPDGFTVQDRIGRIELGVAVGAEQNHEYLYAIVQDAKLFNSGLAFIDVPVELPDPPAMPLSSVFNGLYVSSDFGSSWTRMADTEEVAYNPNTGSTLVPLYIALASYAPGVQGWYNDWIKPDPTRADGGVPTRLTFGLEEVWQNKATAESLDGGNQAGPDDFEVIGGYGAPTHADQHAGLYVPTGDGGVCLFIGNDGGIAKQCVAANEEMDRSKWGRNAANKGIYALLPYGLGVSKDGTVWFGLQDNGTGHIEPRSRFIVENNGGDGIFAEVDPDDGDIAYGERPGADMFVTTNRGGSWTDIKPSAMTGASFVNWFTMDPTDAKHLATGGQEVFETTLGPVVRPDTWVQVFKLGNNPDTGALRRLTTSDLHGDAAYVGYCGDCGVSGNDKGFANGIATNVGGDKPPKKSSADGWHLARAQGLDNRYITAIEIDPADSKTVYVTLGGYLSNLRPPGSYIDPNNRIGSGHVFKSTDAGESFSDISGNLPDAQASGVVLRGGQLLVGTDVGAFISSDTHGSQWAPLGNDLPNVPVEMLRLQPGNPNHLFAATFGRGIWDYTFTGAAAMRVDAPAQSEGSGLFLGAVSPLLLLMLAGGLVLRRRS